MIDEKFKYGGHRWGRGWTPWGSHRASRYWTQPNLTYIDHPHAVVKTLPVTATDGNTNKNNQMIIIILILVLAAIVLLKK